MKENLIIGDSVFARLRFGREPLAWIVSGCSVVFCLILVLTNGSMFYAVASIALCFVVLVTLYRLEWGFLVFIGMVLLFDQFPPRGYDTSIIGTQYFLNLKNLDAFASVDFAVVSPLELQLLLVFLIWVMLIALRKNVYLQRVPLWPLALTFFGWLIISFMHGMATGGDFLPALWELRALFYMGVLYFFVPQIIQTPRQVRSFMWTCMAGIFFKVFQGVVRVLRLGFDFGDRTELTNHEDPLFFVSLFILLFCLVLFRSNLRERKILKWVTPVMLFVFVLAQRRATYAALAVALIALLLLLNWDQFLRVMKFVVPAVFLVIIYLVVFWDSQSGIGMPAQLVKSSFSTTQEEAGDRYYSNLYRKYENYNLASTVKSSPVAGIGFGNKYSQPIVLPPIPFSLRDYISHNEIYWLAVKTGAVGFFLFWLFLDTFVFYAAHVYTKMKHPYFKAVCVVAIVAVLGQVAVSYYDLQLTYSRNMVYLGALMGLLPTLEAIQRAEEVQGAAS